MGTVLSGAPEIDAQAVQSTSSSSSMLVIENFNLEPKINVYLLTQISYRFIIFGVSFKILGIFL